MKAAQLKWMRVCGLTWFNAVCLVGTGDARIEGMMMGRDMDEARRELADFNARRAALGLHQFAV